MVISVVNEMKSLGVTSAFYRKSKRSGEMKDRRVAAFNIRISGEIEFCFEDKTIRVKEGEMIYLPKGSNYKTRLISEESAFIVINLSEDFFPGLPKLYSLENFPQSYQAFTTFGDLWNFGNTGDRYRCLSLLYELCSFVYKYENLKYHDKKKSMVIEPAIEYLKDHIYDTNLKIDGLHQLCGISHTYFRKLFIKRFAMSPKNYVVEKRLSHAKNIIDSGEMDSVKQLALSVGYQDPLYFSKAFKAKYGISPLNMNFQE